MIRNEDIRKIIGKEETIIDTINKRKTKTIRAHTVVAKIIRSIFIEKVFPYCLLLQRVVRKFLLSSVQNKDGLGYFCNNSRMERARELRFSPLCR